MPRKKKTEEKPDIEELELESSAAGEDAAQVQVTESPESPEEPPKSEASQQSTPKPEGNGAKDLLKWVLMGIAAVLIIGGAYFGFAALTGNPIDDNSTKTGLAVIDPLAEVSDDWLLSLEKIGLNKIEPAIRAEFLAQGVVDAANWNFQRGKDEAMYIWIRAYPDKAALKVNNDDFATPFTWSHDITYTTFGENGRAAIYKGAQNSKPPLMFYVERENMMLYIAYFNTDGTNYTATNTTADRAMLIELGRVLYDKLDLYEGLDEMQI